MNGKFILLLFLSLNVATLVGSGFCEEMVNECEFGNNFVLNMFVQEDSLSDFTQNVNTQGGAGLNGNFTSTVGDLTKEQSGGTFIGDSGISFLDGLKMALGVLFLITPIPLISFITSAGLPLILVIILGLIPIILYVIAIMEFVRGASF